MREGGREKGERERDREHKKDSERMKSMKV